MSVRKCSTCEAYESHGKQPQDMGGRPEIEIGLCRASPPIYSSVGPSRITGIWPVIEGDDWCMEWKQNPAGAALAKALANKSQQK